MAVDKIGALIDSRIMHKARITELNKEVKAEQQEIDEIDRQLYDFLNDSQLDRVSKHGYTASLRRHVGIGPDPDWEQIFNYIVENNATHLLYKQLIKSALEEMYDNNESLPGANLQPYVKVSVVKTS
jgi:hypothetical protein